MQGRFLPPEPEKGDPNTVGGYLAVHGRPAAFEGSDLLSYTVEIATDATGEPDRPYGAYFLFVRWRAGLAPAVESHLETAFLEFAPSAAEAARRLSEMQLRDARGELEKLIDASAATDTERKWWEVMRDEDAQ